MGRTYDGRYRRLDLVSMNGFETTVERWHDYYVAAAGAAAEQHGLLFVSLSLHLDRETSEYESRKLPSTNRRSSPKAPSTRFGE